MPYKLVCSKCGDEEGIGNEIRTPHGWITLRSDEVEPERVADLCSDCKMDFYNFLTRKP